MADEKPAPETSLKAPSGPITDLALTLPIFVGYHLGVIFLPVRNAADMVTHELMALADRSLIGYLGLTLGIGIGFVSLLLLFQRGHTLRWQRFASIALEGIVYAIIMRVAAAYIVGRVFLAQGINDPVTGLVMSLGAGFYEELAFRVILFSLGAKLILTLFGGGFRAMVIVPVWAVIAAAVFSGWHHIGAFGDPLDLKVFLFRWVCGLVFTVIYYFRGFAPAVWTHTLYDVWVLVL